MVASSNPETDEPPHRRQSSANTGRVAEPPLLLNRQRTVRGDWDQVRKFLGLLQSRLQQSGFSVCLVSDRAICRYNRQYRQRHEPTDVLSFADRDGEGNGRAYLGDIVISAETARRNARRYGLRLEQEVEILALHGVLHLMGYDHESDGRKMAGLEKHWREQLGLPTSLTERASETRSERRKGRSLAGVN